MNDQELKVIAIRMLDKERLVINLLPRGGYKRKLHCAILEEAKKRGLVVKTISNEA